MLFNRWAYFIFVAFILLCNDQKASSPVDIHPASTQRDIASCCGVQIPICPKCFHTMHPNSFNGRQYLEPRPVVRSWLWGLASGQTHGRAEIVVLHPSVQRSFRLWLCCGDAWWGFFSPEFNKWHNIFL